MKKFLRWAIYLLLVLVALGIAAVLSFDRFAKSVAEKRIRAETGMEAQIGKLEISFKNQRMHLQNFKLINPPEFGSSTFLDLPKLEVQYDFDALRNNQLRLKLVRINLGEIHIVQNKEGRRNIDLLGGKREVVSSNETNRTQKPNPGQTQKLKFAGIDTLEVSLGRAKFTSELNPVQNFERDLGIRNKVYRDIKTEKDLQNVGLTLALHAGFNILMEKMLSQPAVDQSQSGTETILQDIATPAPTNQ